MTASEQNERHLLTLLSLGKVLSMKAAALAYIGIVLIPSWTNMGHGTDENEVPKEDPGYRNNVPKVAKVELISQVGNRRQNRQNKYNFSC